MWELAVWLVVTLLGFVGLVVLAALCVGTASHRAWSESREVSICADGGPDSQADSVTEFDVQWGPARASNVVTFRRHQIFYEQQVRR